MRHHPPPAASSPRSSNRKSYRIASATERLSALEGLPEWFGRSDADGDGQVRMSEYATSWTDDVVADFAQFDLNGDGIVTPKECMNAVDEGAVQGIAPTSTASSSRSIGRGRDRQSSPAAARRVPSATRHPPPRLPRRRQEPHLRVCPPST